MRRDSPGARGTADFNFGLLIGNSTAAECVLEFEAFLLDDHQQEHRRCAVDGMRER